MKKVICLFITAVLMLGLIPAGVTAAVEEYPIWVGGVQVTSENMSGDGWSYEKSESGDDIAIATEGDPSLFIFKTIADPFVGKMSFFKVMSGELKSGVALNPATSLTTLENVLDDVDMVLIMSVNPGFGGQSFIENSIAKIAKLKEMREAAGKDFLIEVDGGVTLDNAVRIAQAGADILVAGSAVFGADSPGERVMTFSKLLGRA